MSETLLVGVIAATTGILGVAIGSLSSLLVQRLQRDREETAFRREALDRFHRDRLQAYGALAASAIRTFDLQQDDPQEAVVGFANVFWANLHLIRWQDYMEYRALLRLLLLASHGAEGDYEALLVQLRAKAGFGTVYQSLAYESHLRGETPPSTEEVEDELARFARGGPFEQAAAATEHELNEVENAGGDADVISDVDSVTLRPGSSVGSAESSVTLCCMVEDPDGAHYLLVPSFTWQEGVAAELWSPGLLVEGPRVRIGSQAQKSERVSAALVAPVPDVAYTSELAHGGGIELVGKPVQPGDEVVMVGAASGEQRGTVLAVKPPVIHTTRVSGAGDAGAPVFASGGNLIGMLTEGRDDGSVVQSIDSILETFDVEVVLD